MKKILSLFVFSLFVSFSASAQTLLLTEDFETDDEGVNYRSNTFNDGSNDVWERWDVATNPSGPNNNFTNSLIGQVGSYAFGGEDLVTSDNPLGSSASCYLTLKTLDISTYANGKCTLKVYVASGPGTFESGDYLRFNYAFDSNISDGANAVDSVPALDSLTSGSYTTIGAFYGISGSDLYADTNLDGVGDLGTDTLNNVFAQYEYVFDVPFGASNLSIQVEARLDAGSEEGAIDHIQVYGDLTTSPLAGSINVDNHVSCNGLSDGSLTATASLGAGPYSFLWSNGGNTATINNLAAGAYTVTITDNLGSTLSFSETITEPAAIVVSAVVDSNASASGASDGGITATVTGGTGLYTYNWSGGTVTNLFSQSFESDATDNWNYTAFPATYNTEGDSIIDGSDDVWAVLQEFTNDIDTASDGLLFWGGQDLNNPNGGGFFYHTLAFDALDISALNNVYVSFQYFTDGYDSSDSLQYQVKFDNGTNWDTTGIDLIKNTQSWETVTIAVPDAANFVRLRVQARQDGSSDFVGFDNFQMFSGSSSVNGLAAGTYTITVTDSLGCTATTSATVTEPAASISASVTIDSNVTCNGFSDGGATATVTGGTSPYTFLWSNSATTASITGVAAGTYTVTVTDNSGTTGTASGMITQPTAVTVNTTKSDAFCNGQATGSATATASGGTSPYTYLWSNAATTASITNLLAGTYTVTATDANGCTGTSSVVVGQPSAIMANPSVTNVSCFAGADGAISLSTSGGIAPYTYLWSTGNTSQNITGLLAGAYTVTITDGLGCTASSTSTVTEPLPFTTSATSSNISCNGLNDGSITLTTTGGTAPYSYVWSTGATGPILNGVGAGSYTVTITDANGCSNNATTITLTQPTGIVTTLTTTDVSTVGGNDGSISATVAGGTPAYTFAWSNGGTGSSITNLAAGTYTVTVTDANGCTNVETDVVNQPGGLANIVITEINYNPPESGTDTTEFIEFVNAGSTMVDLNGYSFTQGVTYTFGSMTVMPGQYFIGALDTTAFRNRFGFAADFQWASGGLSNGGEDITLIDNFGRTVDSVDYDDNTPWPTSPDGGGTTLVLCDSSADNNDPANWSAAISPVAGVIVNGQQVFANPGQAASCVAPLVATITVDSNVSCNGFADGGLTASGTGGMMPLTYAWSNGGTTASITGLVAGTYSVTVTDALGTTDSSSAIVTEPSPIAVSDAVSNVSTVGGSDGSIDITVTGGTAPYAYLWSSGATTEDISNLTVGTYTVTVTDANGCTETNASIVNGPSAVVTTVTSTDVSCNGGNDGTATVTATGGSAPYTFTWSAFGAATPTITGLTAGTYTVTVTDAAGTTAVDSAVVNEPALLTVVVVVDSNASCTGCADGGLTATASGGTPAYTYTWSNATTSPSITGLVAGTYTVTVTDANGCSGTANGTVIEPGPLVDIIITEIMYNPPESGTDSLEFIEMVNAGPNPVNLNGYTFTQGVTHTFGNLMIMPGQYFVGAVDSAAFRNVFGIDADYVWTAGGLSNGGEDITLVDNFGRTVDSVDYDDNAPWPAGGAAGQPDGGGASIVLIDTLLDNNIGSNWMASVTSVAGQVINGFQVFASPGMSSIGVGIEELTTAKEALIIYPNPARNIVTVTFNGQIDLLETMKIYDMTGKMVMETRLEQTTVELDLSSLDNGLYMIRYRNEMKKLIIGR